jgi:hypothetical protein
MMVPGNTSSQFPKGINTVRLQLRPSREHYGNIFYTVPPSFSILITNGAAFEVFFTFRANYENDVYIKRVFMNTDDSKFVINKLIAVYFIIQNSMPI